MCGTVPEPEPEQMRRLIPKVQLAPWLKLNPECYPRERLFKRAEAWHEGSFLSDSDRYGLNWILAGISKCFEVIIMLE